MTTQPPALKGILALVAGIAIFSVQDLILKLILSAASGNALAQSDSDPLPVADHPLL